MKFIDLFASNPYSHAIGEKVMGKSNNNLICGIIIDREHHGKENAYIIESEFGKDYSGTLYEGSIKPYDEKLVLDEIKRNNRLTIKILFDFGTSVIVEKDRKEIFWQNLEDEDGDIDPSKLLKAFQQLLESLGFQADTYRMYLGDGLLALQFDEGKISEKNAEIEKTTNHE